MGLGSTAKKVQLVAERAEQMVEQIVELRERIVSLEGSMEDTSERVKRLEHQNEVQGALLEAIANEQGIDVDDIVAKATITEAEPEGAEDDADGETADEKPLVEDAEGEANGSDTGTPTEGT